MKSTQEYNLDVYPTKFFKNLPYVPKKNMLSRPFWRLAETKISAGLSRVTGPAELIEMAQYTWSIPLLNKSFSSTQESYGGT